jgi:hypothetical protein
MLADVPDSNGHRIAGESYANSAPRVHQISESPLRSSSLTRSFATTDRELRHIDRQA